jgi:HEPN domain-containing protein
MRSFLAWAKNLKKELRKELWCSQNRWKPCDKSKYTIYLERAEQCKEAATVCFERRWWSACVINAIHAVIALADAFSVYKTGRRWAGQDHREATDRLTKEVAAPGGKEVERYAKHMRYLIEIKTDAEYGDQNIKEKDAMNALNHMKKCFEIMKPKFL